MRNILDRAVADAQSNSDAARAQLLGTFGTLRRRVTPRALFFSAIENVSTRTENLLDSAQASARRSPLATSGGIAAFALAVGLRVWLSRQKRSDADETTL